MKAMVYTKYGTPDVLKLEEVEKPTPKDNEVLVKIYAASVNSWDWDLLRGTPFIVRIGGLFKPKYQILGADIAGRVEAVGRNVKQFLPGDEVFGDISGCGWGGFAEYVCACEEALTLKPASMTHEQAASIPQAAVLALQGLRHKGQIQPKQKVLINGAGGGVGTFAVQMAKSCGAEVTGVDSTKKLEMLKSLGADHVIDYTKDDYTQNRQRYDLILDVAGNRSIFDNKRALNRSGTYVMVGGSLARIFQVMLLGPWISRTGNKKMGILVHRPNNNDQQYMMELFEAGKVAPVLDRRYPLSQVDDAVRYFADGQHKGKIIVYVEHTNDA
ncbi:NAD(P)-dependent alcohol dehydrogenase [Paenibacillus alba]|uniref:NAD(P)-dependent alcohol dehydrogenase n=1 Tax=Paenibacillus alba TaxID=1197127 RepID=UPI0015667DA8|nr:NAD(P)-dependent alcohol dehydrogenase [Paenibacillus alba]NQX66179.1 NAD(P)-dependent alcohol dehydrogenase [Paenibacillus alba]